MVPPVGRSRSAASDAEPESRIAGVVPMRQSAHFTQSGNRSRSHQEHFIRSRGVRVKAAVHWVRVNALSAESSPKLTWDVMGLRADSARRLSVRAEPLTR